VVVGVVEGGGLLLGGGLVQCFQVIVRVFFCELRLLLLVEGF
jgi:hypothetical protein